MKRNVTRPPKVSLCRMCGGTGRVNVDHPQVCPQCEGSGRVIVSGTMELDIQPYKPRRS